MRPTGIVDPEIEVRETKNQIDDLMNEIKGVAEAGDRVLVTTLTKKMAEDLTNYLLEYGVKVRYLHSEIDTLERIQIVRDLRLGEYDVLVGVNLLREGLDLPEVSLVAILDADKEGFLRGETSLVQTIGRAARNVEGRVLMYADKETDAMRAAIRETDRRRAIQVAYNEEHGITPATVRKGISEMSEFLAMEDRAPRAPPARADRSGDARGARAPGRRPRGGDAGRRRRPALRGGGAPPRRAQRAAPRPRRDAGRQPEPALGAAGRGVLLGPGGDLLRAADPLAVVRLQSRDPVLARVLLDLLASRRLQGTGDRPQRVGVLDLRVVPGRLQGP